MSTDAADLRARAEAESGGLPALVLSAERLAALIAPGAHGLRRSGPGEDFWQYRPAREGDTARSIDWRRSARSDAQFVRDREAQSAEAAVIWASAGQGMGYRGAASRPTKRDRARLLALALGMVLLRGGERVGLAGQPPRAGRLQTDRLAQGLALQAEAGTDADQPPLTALRPNQRVVLISDFLGDPAWVSDYLARAAALGVSGALLQVLDPDEEVFPFDGAVLFRSVSGRVSHDTRDAAGLRAAYLERLAERRDLLTRGAQGAGWHFGTHDTATPPAAALMWLYQVLGG
ncbi:DUF58 domain-containing protein [Paracoccus zhejiangensis]|uniref:DUF58 domain-containing protein n=1 Tax=Paracoccus zhejiangensis TaxID=1077935 RepID=A0A2H5EWG9_9RHOB|nr:DUF58 domain-containing protein [Paracoccus zhejiangensis]AUH63656.1 hypothetical protein CX676_05345 [Paracoccus zhejiangensis]